MVVVAASVARVRSVTMERLMEERALVTGDLRGGDRVGSLQAKIPPRRS